MAKGFRTGQRSGLSSRRRPVAGGFKTNEIQNSSPPLGTHASSVPRLGKATKEQQSWFGSVCLSAEGDPLGTHASSVPRLGKATKSQQSCFGNVCPFAGGDPLGTHASSVSASEGGARWKRAYPGHRADSLHVGIGVDRMRRL